MFTRKELLCAALAAIAEAGLGGIQFFHGGWAKDEPWPGVTNMVPEATGSDMVTTVNYHRYAKQSSAELIAEGAIS